MGPQLNSENRRWRRHKRGMEGGSEGRDSEREGPSLVALVAADFRAHFQGVEVVHVPAAAWEGGRR